MAALGLLIIRLVFGLSFMGHGAQKLFGSFGGYGIKGTAQWFESIGVKPGVFMVVISGLIEFVGGLLLALGLFTPVVAILIALTMVVAIVKVHAPNGYLAAGGYEFNLTIIAVMVGLALIGAGQYSIDALLF